jgi:hypothetical protein
LDTESQRKREVTGAVSVVDSKTLEALKPVKIEQALQEQFRKCYNYVRFSGCRFDIRIRGMQLMVITNINHY